MIVPVVSLVEGSRVRACVYSCVYVYVQNNEPTNSLGAVEDRSQGVIASSVKRPEAAAVDRYVHGKILPAYANHIQVCLGIF